MKEILEFEHAEKSLYYRFRNILAPNLHFTNFDVETKLKIAKKFNLILNADFIQELNKSWDLIFDAVGCVEEFSWKSLTDSENRKRTSSEDFANGNSKKIKYNFPEMEDYQAPNTSTDASFYQNLQKIISNTIETANRALIEELKSQKTEIVVSSKPPTSNGLKHYLDGLRGLVNHIESSELTDITKRIDSLEKSLDDTEKPLPISHIRAMLDFGLKTIGG
ncbi:Protein CBG00448 [Caenorhabditis briggsae]|nr:Protein CBG00448 [Caenorhabditis briggsae]CAP21897.2 Protein CBG00448 [Caenorhabditis briggsae]